MRTSVLLRMNLAERRCPVADITNKRYSPAFVAEVNPNCQGCTFHQYPTILAMIRHDKSHLLYSRQTMISHGKF